MSDDRRKKEEERRKKDDERAEAAWGDQPFGARTYATAAIRAERRYQRAVELESSLPSGLWMNPVAPTDVLEVLIDAWEEAGFGGWADNYRAEVERRRKTGRYAARDANRGMRSSKSSTPSARGSSREISEKIGILRREGYEQRQAIAIAHRMAGVSPRSQDRKRDPAEPPESGVRLRGERRRQKRHKVLDYEGVPYYPFEVVFTTDDGKRRRKVLYAPGAPWRRDTVARFFQAEDMIILPGSSVHVRWLPIDERSR